MKNILFISVILLISFSSCKDPVEKEQEEIQQYIQNNNITTEPTASGLYYIETLEGTGKAPKYGAYVKVNYKGTYLNGEVFDESKGDPIGFNLGQGQVIRGWDEGIMYMKEGGKAQLLVPSRLAYGSYGRGDIDGYTPLFFEVELVKVSNP